MHASKPRWTTATGGLEPPPPRWRESGLSTSTPLPPVGTQRYLVEWIDLRAGLDTFATAESPRTTARQERADRVFPEWLDIPAPAITERVTGHGDLQWANLTHHPLVLLGWERWGGCGAVRLRPRRTVPLAEFLQAVGRGWYVESVPLTAGRASELVGRTVTAPRLHHLSNHRQGWWVRRGSASRPSRPCRWRTVTSGDAPTPVGSVRVGGGPCTSRAA